MAKEPIPSSYQTTITLVYAVRNLLFWYDEYQSEGEWTALKNESTWRERVRELLPDAIQWADTMKDQ